MLYIQGTGVFLHACHIINISDPRNVLRLEEKPIPTPGSNQVLIRVHAAALNPSGYKMMKYFPSIAVKKPAIPENDVAGIVVSVGADIQQWHPGDKVFGIIRASDMFRRGQGGLSEYALLHANNMSPSLGPCSNM